MITALGLDSGAANVVQALVVLSTCGVVFLLVAGYVLLVHVYFGEELTSRFEYAFDGPSTAAIMKIALHLAGWVLILVSLFRSEWNGAFFENALADTALKALATWPAAVASALLTCLVVIVLRGRTQQRWWRLSTVGACMVIGTLPMAWVFVLAAWAAPGSSSGLPDLIAILGYAPLMLVAIIVLAVTVGSGFLVGLTHSRAAGIRTALFAIGLVATVGWLKQHGPIHLPHIGGEPVTAAIVIPEVGAVGAGLLLLAGALGILFPTETANDVG